jgi:hypothetical protein
MKETRKHILESDNFEVIHILHTLSTVLDVDKNTRKSKV